MKSINILGPFSTGTNLINNIIKEATNIKLVELIHKHDDDFFKLENFIKNNPNVLFIVMYRPLFSWIESMKKHSYEIIWDKKDITSPASLFEKSYDNITRATFPKSKIYDDTDCNTNETIGEPTIYIIVKYNFLKITFI
jgi:hypothetical protein